MPRVHLPGAYRCLLGEGCVLVVNNDVNRAVATQRRDIMDLCCVRSRELMSSVGYRELSTREGYTLCDVVSRINRQVQDMNRVNLCARHDCIVVNTGLAVVAVLGAPCIDIAVAHCVAERACLCTRSLLLQRYGQNITAVATEARLMNIFIKTVGGDGLTMPFQHIAQCNRILFLDTEGSTLDEDDRGDRVTTRARFERVNDYRVIRDSQCVPTNRLACAEWDSTGRT